MQQKGAGAANRKSAMEAEKNCADKLAETQGKLDKTDAEIDKLRAQNS